MTNWTSSTVLGVELLLVAAVAAGRDQGTSTGVNALAAQLQRQSACHDLAGTVTETLTGLNTAAGTIEGDLEGDVSIVITFGPVTGKVQHFTAVHTIGPITGGSVAELVGKTLTTSDRGLLVGDPPVFRINNHLEVVGGANGEVTTHGTLDLTVPHDQVHLSYHAVVCL